MGGMYRIIESLVGIAEGLGVRFVYDAPVKQIVRGLFGDEAHMAALRTARCNEKHLPGHPFPEGLAIADGLEAAVRGADEILIVVPSHAFVSTLETIEPWLKPGQGIAWARNAFGS